MVWSYIYGATYMELQSTLMPGYDGDADREQLIQMY